MTSTGPDEAFENAARARGHSIVAGVDEAGRGPLAGPVVAAAVVLPHDLDLPGLDDSKRLAAGRRRALCARILAHAEVGLAVVPAPLIDRLNIRVASLRAMVQALNALARLPDFALIDGRDLPVPLPCPGEAVVQGDRRSRSIAAASVVAKVVRDAIMTRAGADFPGYGFADHAGYPTPDHRAALGQMGLCPLHRRSFGPCKNGTA